MGKMILIENKTCRERDNGMCVYDTGLSINEALFSEPIASYFLAKSHLFMANLMQVWMTSMSLPMA